MFRRRRRRPYGPDAEASEDTEPHHLPPLRLTVDAHNDGGDQAAPRASGSAEEPPSASPNLRRLAWLPWAGGFAVGAAAGVLVVNALTGDADGAPVALLAGDLSPTYDAFVGPPDPAVAVPMDVTLFNPGSRPVEIMSVDIPGWTIDDDFGTVTLDPGSWETVPLQAQADCEATVDSTVLDFVVDTGDGRTSVSAELLPDSIYEREPRFFMCQQDSSPTWVDAVGLQASTDRGSSDVLVATLELEVRGDGESTIVDVDVDARAFEVTVLDLPTELSPGERVRIALEWRIADCSEVDDYRGALINVSLSDSSEEGLGQVVMDVAPPESIDLPLLRFAQEACG